MKLLVTKIVKETEHAVTIFFKNNSFLKRINYKPGQFITLKIPINGRIENRVYSFSSSPLIEKELKITVKRVNGGLVSNYLNDTLKIGDSIDVEKPAGNFFIIPDKNARNQYVLFAGGSGITPIYSILKSVLSKELHSNVLLVYANKDIKDIIFFEELNVFKEQYSNRLKIEYILNENTNTDFYSGFLNEVMLENILRKNKLTFSNYKYMVCGPVGYMDVVVEILKNKKIQNNQIKLERFNNPEVKLYSNGVASTVTIIYNNETHKISVPNNKTILQQVIYENIELPYSCRSGACSTCKASCISGEVSMIEGHFLEDKEVDSGKILTCVSYPKSEEVVIEILS